MTRRFVRRTWDLTAPRLGWWMLGFIIGYHLGYQDCDAYHRYHR